MHFPRFGIEHGQRSFNDIVDLITRMHICRQKLHAGRKLILGDKEPVRAGIVPVKIAILGLVGIDKLFRLRPGDNYRLLFIRRKRKISDPIR